MESDFDGFDDFTQDGQLSRQSYGLKIRVSMVRSHYHPLCSHLLKGLGQHPFKVQMRVRFPLGVLPETALVNVTQYVPYNKSNGKALPLLDMHVQCQRIARLPSKQEGTVRIRLRALYSRLVQLVERLAVNQYVAGSSPVVGADSIVIGCYSKLNKSILNEDLSKEEYEKGERFKNERLLLLSTD